MIQSSLAILVSKTCVIDQFKVVGVNKKEGGRYTYYILMRKEEIERLQCHISIFPQADLVCG